MGTERALLSLYGSGPGAGCPLNLMHACMPAFYGSKRSQDVRLVTGFTSWQRLVPAGLRRGRVPSPLTRFQVLSPRGAACYMFQAGRSCFDDLDRSIGLQPRRSDWWKLHSELTDTLVAPSASNTLSRPPLSYQHHIQSPLNPFDKLLNTA